MNFTKRLFSVEKQHFNRLSMQAQQLIMTFSFFNIIFPIFSLFTNAFIWRQSQDVNIIAIFNLAIFMTMPLGFYINGHLLQKFLPARLYFTGILLYAVIVAALIFFPIISPVSVFAFGAAIGLSGSLLWANRSLLILRITLSENRIYFSSIDSTISIILSILIPVLIGTFIVFGQTADIYTPTQAYYGLVVLIFVVVFFIFKRVKNVTTKLPQLNEIGLKNPTAKWKKMRYFLFVNGLFNGMTTFVPIIMVLAFVGKEDALGIVQSLSSVIAAIIIYSIGKKINREQRLWILGGYVIFSILASFSFAALYSVVGVFLFYALNAIAQPLCNVGWTTLYFDVIENENQKKESHYANIFDAEIFLNMGRIVGIMSFITISYFISEAAALRYTLFIFTISLVLLFFIARSIEKGHMKELPTNQTTEPEVKLTI